MKKHLIAAMLAAGCVLCPAYGQAVGNGDESGTTYAGGSAEEGRFFRHSPDYYKIQDESDVSDEGTAEQEQKIQTKYAFLMSDKSYNYYVDTENVQWKPLPYSSSEYMIDAWLILTPAEFVIIDEPPAKYYLEHYYLRPKTRQVQFLCELEVTERPQNVISERAYNVRNWENLVPGSMEDRIYKELLQLMKKKGYGGKTPPRDSFRDMLEEYLRISL